MAETITDIMAQRRQTVEAENLEQSFDKAFSSARDDRDLGFDLLHACAFRLRGETLDWTSPEQACALLRLPPHLLPKHWSQWQNFIVEDDRAGVEKACRSLSWEGAKATTQFRIKNADDESRYLELSLLCQDREADLKFGVLRDVSKDRERLERAARLSGSDPLTGLPNKRHFIDSVDRLALMAHRLKSEGYLFRLHLKNLEAIHQIYGPQSGETVVRAFAERLQLVIHSPDCAGREVDGDFFIAVLGIGGMDGDPNVLGQRLKLALSERSYVTPQGKIKLQLDVSYTLFPQNNRTVETLLAQTARSLEVKTDEPVSAYKPIMGLPKLRSEQRLSADDIKAALNEDRIALAYQPIIAARSGALSHYECLLRLRQANGELESAGKLIMAAEKLGVVHLLDLRALQIAKGQLNDRSDLRVSLNVSAETVKDKATAQDYLAALETLGAHAKRVTLELTETATLNDPSLAAEFANEARALGCDFAIDDFGSGHTSFRNLMAIEAETIKIDGSHVRGISTQPHMQSFVRMMVDLAQTFSVNTVAEMVEYPADAALLRRLGVDYFQGYLFGLPQSEPSYYRAE